MKLKIFSHYFIYAFFLLFSLNTLSTFFRYTEPYIFFTPKWLKMTWDLNYWEKNWKFIPILPYLQKGKKIAVDTDNFDFFYYEFNLFPHEVRHFNPSHLSDFDLLIINPAKSIIFNSHDQSNQLKENWVMKTNYHFKNDHFQIWQKRN